MSDVLYRGIIEKLNVRFAYAVTTSAANDAVLAHGVDPVAAHLMVRALTAAVLSSPLLNDDERLTIHWRYQGAIRSLIMDVGADSDVRGFISPPNLSQFVDAEEDLFGDSCIVKVTKSDSRALLNNGQTTSIFRDPVADLAFTYSFSDQVESGMCAMVAFDPDPEKPVALAQGLLIQAMPDCDLEVFDDVRKRLDSESVRDRLKTPPAHDNWVEEILKVLTDDAECEVAITVCPEPTFACNCTEERMLGAVKTLAQDQRDEVLAKGEDLTVTCHFCNARHIISIDTLKQIFT